MILETQSPFPPPSLSSAAQPRVDALFAKYEAQVFTRTNRLFLWLLAGQWIFALGLALIVSPRTWAGNESALHPHLLAAVFLGGLFVIPPFLLIRWMPQEAITRHAVALAQMGFSGLLIHLTGGREETHFHVFGSLAFLALYRDWRVLITATLITALDHLVRGFWFPESVYGIPYTSVWRTLEHAGWVIFEDIVLVWACFDSRREMREISQRQEEHEQFHAELEQRVRDRTAALQSEIVERERAAASLRVSEERYRALIGNIPIGIFKTTRRGEVRVANPYLLDLLGLPLDIDLSRIDMSQGKIFPPAERERMWARLDAAGEVRGFETTLTRGDGTTIDVVINARLKSTPLPDGSHPCEGTIEDVTERKHASRQLDTLNRQLVHASREAGMAEVATGVLHNVGNVLTSVNLTVQNVQDRVAASRIGHLQRAVDMIQRERHRLADFLETDSVGKQLPDFLARLSENFATDNQLLRADLESLGKHCEHIREIVVTQQSSATSLGLIENIAPEQLFEDALRLTAESLDRHHIKLERDFFPTATVRADRHRVLQILVNFIRNAKDSLQEAGPADACIRVRVSTGDQNFVALAVSDNGLGIAPEHLGKIFQHGFTTKATGHGFGLHSCALAAREMNGSITVHSEGRGRGATFTLLLPVASR